MIRKLREEDLDRVMQIWLDTNIKTHNFISANYWQDHLESVRDILPQSEVYVYENNHEIQGFIGLDDCYIAGIFVWDEAQSKGAGKQLLDYAKRLKERLTLSVYQRNERAIKFYQRENFKIQSENSDKDTGEKEYFMVWE